MDTFVGVVDSTEVSILSWPFEDLLFLWSMGWAGRGCSGGLSGAASTAG